MRMFTLFNTKGVQQLLKTECDVPQVAAVLAHLLHDDILAVAVPVL